MSTLDGALSLYAARELVFYLAVYMLALFGIMATQGKQMSHLRLVLMLVTGFGAVLFAALFILLGVAS